MPTSQETYGPRRAGHSDHDRHGTLTTRKSTRLLQEEDAKGPMREAVSCFSLCDFVAAPAQRDSTRAIFRTFVASSAIFDRFSFSYRLRF